ALLLLASPSLALFAGIAGLAIMSRQQLFQPRDFAVGGFLASLGGFFPSLGGFFAGRNELTVSVVKAHPGSALAEKLPGPGSDPYLELLAPQPALVIALELDVALPLIQTPPF